jgi:hypothetical protein
MGRSDPNLILLASRDPVVFISYYSGMRLKEFHCQVLYAIEANARIIILLPATHGKSTLLSLWYVIYKIAQNRNVRIILLMKNDEELKAYARSLRTIFATNKQLMYDFGHFVPQGRDIVWSNDAITVSGRQIPDPQPTVLFASAATIDQALGKRCDIFMGDDFVTPSTVSTQSQRDKQATIFNEGIETSPQYIWDRGEDGKLLVPAGIDWPEDIEYEKGAIYGTVFHPDDLFHRKVGKVPKIGTIANLPHGKLVRAGKDKAYVVLKFSCWEDPEKTIPIWPERWSAEKLRAKEESIGRIEFQRRFENIAIDEGSLVFKKVWLHGGTENEILYPGCLDRTRRMGEIPKDVNHIVVGLDPSTGRTSRGASFTVAIVLGVNTREDPPKRYLIDLYRGQIGYDDIISLLTYGNELVPGLYTLYHYNQARVEANAAQSYLIDNDRVRQAGYNGVRIVPHETQSRNKSDPLIGVSSMQAIVKDGLLSIPYINEPSTMEKAEHLIDEMELFPEEPNDCCMALWFAEISVRKLGSSYTCFNAGPGPYIRNPRHG